MLHYSKNGNRLHVTCLHLMPVWIAVPNYSEFLIYFIVPCTLHWVHCLCSKKRMAFCICYRAKGNNTRTAEA